VPVEGDEAEPGLLHARPDRVQEAARQARQDFLEVWVKKLLTSGRSAVLPHFGHATAPLPCSLIDWVISTSRRHLSQWYSYTGMTTPP